MITHVAHIGIRVHDLERSTAFYEKLGFAFTAGPLGPEPAAILEHPSGVVINLILNASQPDDTNVLMDVPQKHPGYTHAAFAVEDVATAQQTLESAGVVITEGPVSFPGGTSIFFRDPDRNVIELHQLA